MNRLKILAVFLLLAAQNALAGDATSTVLSWQIDKKLETAYEIVYKHLEEKRFYVVFEPNIQRNLETFAERWGDDYNRNRLEGIRAMVFCNGWYANQVSNADPTMLALCPLHITLVQKDEQTRVLFSRPTVIAAGSPALEIIGEVESAVVEAIDAAVAELNARP